MNFVSLNRKTAPEKQAGFVALEELKKPWVERFLVYRGRTIPQVKTSLSNADRLGAVKVRWDMGRMGYRVLPGLYAIGEPGPASDVFVTANYKLSFDTLRSSLAGLSAWLMVLDTKGINVWCAAGKGSFGTDELVGRIRKTELGRLVDHRRIVLPQLGAPGVAAHEVKRRSGFQVEWGPVRAGDIKAWLEKDRVKDVRMREVRFDLRDRLAVAPVELVHGWPILPGAAMLAFLYALPPGPGWLTRAPGMFLALAALLPLGALLFPAFLPWLPSRAFAVKGAFLGLLWGLVGGAMLHLPLLAALALCLVGMPVVAFVAMNFTGSSTFTCQPGALLEVERGFFPMLITFVAGLALGALSRLFGI